HPASNCDDCRPVWASGHPPARQSMLVSEAKLLPAVIKTKFSLTSNALIVCKRRAPGCNSPFWVKMVGHSKKTAEAQGVPLFLLRSWAIRGAHAGGRQRPDQHRCRQVAGRDFPDRLHDLSQKRARIGQWTRPIRARVFFGRALHVG